MTVKEPINLWSENNFTIQGILEHLNVTKDSSDYLWYITRYINSNFWSGYMSINLCGKRNFIWMDIFVAKLCFTHCVSTIVWWSEFTLRTKNDNIWLLNLWNRWKKYLYLMKHSAWYYLLHPSLPPLGSCTYFSFLLLVTIGRGKKNLMPRLWWWIAQLIISSFLAWLTKISKCVISGFLLNCDSYWTCKSCFLKLCSICIMIYWSTP